MEEKNNLKARSVQTFRKSKNGFNSKRGKISLKQVFGVKTCLAPAGTTGGTGGGIASNDGGRGGGASPAGSGQKRTPMSIGNCPLIQISALFTVRICVYRIYLFCVKLIQTPNSAVNEGWKSLRTSEPYYSGGFTALEIDRWNCWKPQTTPGNGMLTYFRIFRRLGNKMYHTDLNGPMEGIQLFKHRNLQQ